MSTHRLWRLVDLLHGLVYFAPERAEHYAPLGFKGGWMGYFATRSAALGVVPPQVVTACFYSFAPAMVERALPDAWRHTSPAQAQAARIKVFCSAFERMSAGRVGEGDLARAAELGVAVARLCPVEGRPLSAAHQALPVPTAPLEALFWACTVLREFRGDGHLVALGAARVDGCEANVLMVALGKVSANQQKFRGFDDEQWAAARGRLTGRGWLDGDGAATELGVAERARIEEVTDSLCACVQQAAGAAVFDELAELLARIGAGLA